MKMRGWKSKSLHGWLGLNNVVQSAYARVT